MTAEARSNDPVSLIVGLGNPGAEYAGTRHNAGFLVAEAVVSRLRNRSEGAAFYSRCVRGAFAGRNVEVLMPRTYMNRSGEAVAGALRDGRCRASEVLVVYDCLDLEFGRIRLRASGGSGGHRGLQSVQDCLGTTEIPRLRVGIGRSEHGGDAVDYVLGRWDGWQAARLDEVVGAGADAALTAVRRGVTAAMNAYNSWKMADTDANAGPQGESEKKEPNTESEH